VEIYEKVRRAHIIDGKSQRQIARELGINRRSIQRMLTHSSPPGYQRIVPVTKPKLSAHISWIDDLLAFDKKVHAKQRHSAKRIYERLKVERSYDGSYSTVRTYVATCKQRSKEMFVPLVHEPGMAQCDFGEAFVIINGQECKAHFLVMQLPFSDGVFVKAYPAENTESFCDAHACAFIFFNGVPKRILYDNTTIAVKKILDDKTRVETKGFTALKSHYLFESAFANVARGNEKGGVENLVGYVRRNFMVPKPEFESFDALNAYLVTCCLKRQSEVKRGHALTIGERLAQESYLPLPALPYESYRSQVGKINSQGLVRFQNNDYSVPTTIGQQTVLVKGYVDVVRIIHDHTIIAEHKRSYASESVVLNPMHYLTLLERKAGAFHQAAPLKGWNLPAVFERVQRRLEHKDGKEGIRSYIRILKLLETYALKDVETALKQALALDVVTEVAIVHLVKRRVEKRPLNLVMTNHPAVPSVTVSMPDLSVYGRLGGGC
jgi:transposase